MASTLASGVRSLGFDPQSLGGKVSVSKHTFFRVIDKDDTKSVYCPADLDVN